MLLGVPILKLHRVFHFCNCMFICQFKIIVRAYEYSSKGGHSGIEILIFSLRNGFS